MILEKNAKIRDRVIWSGGGCKYIEEILDITNTKISREVIKYIKRSQYCNEIFRDTIDYYFNNSQDHRMHLIGQERE